MVVGRLRPADMVCHRNTLFQGDLYVSCFGRNSSQADRSRFLGWEVFACQECNITSFLQALQLVLGKV